MSEAKLGETSSTRPGMNVENASFSEAQKPSEHAGKSHKKCRNRRSGKASNGIQAEQNGNPAPKAGEEGKLRENAKKADGENQVLGSSKNSKRRRRRRWNRKRKTEQNAANSLVSSSVAGSPENAPPSASGKVARHKENTQQDSRPEGNKNRGKNDRRRNRRRVPHHTSDADRQNQPAKDGNTGTHGQDSKSGDDNTNRRHRRPSGQKHADAYAALDLGTNNCRLLVAVPQQPGRFRVVDAFSRIVRLGEGLAATGRLGDEAMDRAVGALKACAGKLQSRKVRGVRLIATEACRRADNGIEFLQRVEQEAGLKLEIVDRETEARLAVASCASLVDRKAKGVVLFDIGGGSSELALLDLSKRKRYDLAPAMVSWTSLPHGVVTLSEKHGGGRRVTRAVFDAMVDEVSTLLEAYEGREALVEAGRHGEIHLLGTSGTVTTLAGIHLKLPRYDRRRVDGIWMASRDVDAMIDALVNMSFEERVANPCIGQDRADLVLAGCAILVAIQRLWPCPRLRVADRGLREGLLTEMMNADNAWLRRTKYFRKNQS